MDKDTVQAIEQLLGYTFQDKSLLIKAFTHSSSTDDRIHSYERLEFFGDAVLGMVICQQLFNDYPSCHEGDLTKMKSMLVSRKTCTAVSISLGLIEYLKLGKGMSGSGVVASSISAGLLEAIIAAIYFDGGYREASDFILRSFSEFIHEADSEVRLGNYKSMLQQYSQQNFEAIPVYELLDEKGPDHNKCFESCVVIKGQHFQSAWGTNKKEAEQLAAFNALVELKILEETHGKEE